MKVLHITNDYSGSTVYKNLIGELDKLGISQIVYNPIKNKNRIGKNEIDLVMEDSKIIYSPILNKTTDRIFYRNKIKKIVNDIEQKVDLSKIKLIHAHTWYSDGGAAYILSQKYNIPYVITIRNSDLNVFQKYLIHERHFGRKILEKARNVILIATTYKKRVLELPSLANIKSELFRKIQIIPNGIDNYWIENNLVKRKEIDQVLKILYIGKFDKGKNVLRLINAVDKVNKSFNCELSIVGGGGNQHKKVIKKINEKSFIKYFGEVYDKSELLNIFRTHDLFAMPSKAETFGLVYIEALTQGLPIINTINEGIYGMYENIGESVNFKSIKNIADAIIRIKLNYNQYEIDTIKILENHNWLFISEKYLKIYKSINSV